MRNLADVPFCGRGDVFAAVAASEPACPEMWRALAPAADEAPLAMAASISL